MRNLSKNMFPQANLCSPKVLSKKDAKATEAFVPNEIKLSYRHAAESVYRSKLTAELAV